MSHKIKISKDTTNKSYQINFQSYKNNNNILKIIIQTLFDSNIIQPHTSIITDDYQTLILKAQTFTNFDDFLMKQYETYTPKQFENKKYEIAIQIINDLMKQLISLFHYKYTFYAFSLENIFVIDNEHFIYLNTDHLLPFDLNKNITTITLKIPFQRDKPGLFLSPEIQQIDKLPFCISYKTIYYSLGCLIIYFLFEKKISTFTNEESTKENQDQIKEILRPIKETKLYWFILRVMKTDPNERWIHF